MRSIEICPSILDSKDVKNFLNNISRLNEEKIKNNISYIHIDIMDKKFVSGEGVSLGLAETVTSFGFLNDIHLMVEDVKEYIDKAMKYNPSVLTIHYEAPNFEENLKYLNRIRISKKYKYFDIGVSIKPDTDVEVLEKYKELFDVILIMSVEPGKGGQAFLDSTYDKIEKTKIILSDKIIELDGGINDKNIKKIIKSGIDRVVIGSYLSKTKDFNELEEKFNKLRGK